MYASSNSMMNPPCGQGHSIANMMANTHIGASPRAQPYVSAVQDLKQGPAPQATASQASTYPGSAVPMPIYPLQQPPSGIPNTHAPKCASAKQDWSPFAQPAACVPLSPRQTAEGQALPAGPSVCTPPIATRTHTQAAPSGPQRMPSGTAPARPISGVKQPSSGYPGVALTPAQTLIRYGGVNALTEFEQGEVLHYPQVYYVGAGAKKHCPHPSQRVLLAAGIRRRTRTQWMTIGALILFQTTLNATLSAEDNNRGFDDDRGDYRPIAHDHLAYRFEIISILGKGSFGQVLKCYDYKDQVLRAVKIIRNKTRFHHQARVELKILHHLVTQVCISFICARPNSQYLVTLQRMWNAGQT